MQLRYAGRALGLAALIFQLAGCAFDARTVDLRDVDRSRAPNDGLACPPGICRAAPDVESPLFAISRTELTDMVREVFKARPRTELVGEDAALGQLVFVQRSRLFGFPDTVWVQGAGIDGRASVIIYSRSNYGYWDFGVNRARVRSWLKILARAINAKGRYQPIALGSQSARSG